MLVASQEVSSLRAASGSDVRLRVLLLADVRPDGLDFAGRHIAGTMLDHINALSGSSRHHVYRLNPRGWTAPETIEFDQFDALVIHYSISVIHDDYLPPVFWKRIRAFTGLKVIFIQDEYRQVNAYVDRMIDLGIHALFTCVPETSIDAVYGRLRDHGVTIIPTLTGFVSDELARRPRRPLRERPLDVVYRGRPLPYALGDLAQEKVEIARHFIDEGQRYGLAVDIDWREEARIYGDCWIDFMSSGRATLGTESGASIVDFDESIASAVAAYRRRHPDAEYPEVADVVLNQHEGNIVINTISPRAFEAICLGTALVLFPGDYSGILVPWRHYIPLAKDFSNIEEIVGCLTDLPFLDRLTQTAYDEIVNPGTYSYDAFTKKIDNALADFWLKHEGRGRAQSSVGWFDADAWRWTLDARVARLTGLPAPRGKADLPPEEPATRTQVVAKWLLPIPIYRALRPLVHWYLNGLNSIAADYLGVSSSIRALVHSLKVRKSSARQGVRLALLQIIQKVALSTFRLWPADEVAGNIPIATDREGCVRVVHIAPAEKLPRLNGTSYWGDLQAQVREEGVTTVRFEPVQGMRWRAPARVLSHLLARLRPEAVLKCIAPPSLPGEASAEPPALQAVTPNYSRALFDTVTTWPELVGAMHRLHRGVSGQQAFPPFGRLSEESPRRLRHSGRRSIAFLHHSYYNFYYLASALRRRGWDAINVTRYAPDDPRQLFFHGEDLSLWDADEAIMADKIYAFFREARSRFGMIHFYGVGVGSFFDRNWDVNSEYLTIPWDFLELKRHGVKIGYTECGCLDLVSQSSFYRWSKGACDFCIYQNQPDVCSDLRNLAWGRKVQMMCDLVCVEGDTILDMKSGPKVFREPLTLALDPELWRPGLDIPEHLRLRRDESELILYHAVGNFSERTNKVGKNLKGTGAIVDAIDRLRAEGHKVRLEFITNMPNKDVRFIQAQADIVIDQLHYGRYGANAREGMMLGRPVVGALNKSEEAPGAESMCIAEAPIVHATEATIYDVLKDLVLSPEKRRSIGEASRDHALKWWSVDSCAARFETMYDRLMAGKPIWPNAPDFRRAAGL